MTSPNKYHQSGHARAYIKQEWGYPCTSELYVSLGDDMVATFDKGTIVVRTVIEGTVPNPDDVCLAWAEPLTDTIVDMFKAIGKALDIYSDEPSQAYKQGYAEGESKVLREWNQSMLPPQPPAPSPTFAPKLVPQVQDFIRRPEQGKLF